MAKDFFVTVHGPRGDELELFLGTRRFCVQSPVPSRADLPGHPNAEIYMLDLEELTPEQREALVKYLALKFFVPRAVVTRDLDAHGVPILAEDCTVAVHSPQRWLT